jgi:hypothetical protein
LQATPFGQQEEQNMHSQVQRHSNAANTPTILERSIADVIERESRYQDILDTHVKYHLPDRTSGSAAWTTTASRRIAKAC